MQRDHLHACWHDAASTARSHPPSGQWCSSRSMSAAAMTSSPSTPPHSSKPLFEVSTVDARSTPRRGHEENWKFETHRPHGGDELVLCSSGRTARWPRVLSRRSQRRGDAHGYLRRAHSGRRRRRIRPGACGLAVGAVAGRRIRHHHRLRSARLRERRRRARQSTGARHCATRRAEGHTERRRRHRRVPSGRRGSQLHGARHRTHCRDQHAVGRWWRDRWRDAGRGESSDRRPGFCRHGSSCPGAPRATPARGDGGARRYHVLTLRDG